MTKRVCVNCEAQVFVCWLVVEKVHVSAFGEGCEYFASQTCEEGSDNCVLGLLSTSVSFTISCAWQRAVVFG